MRTVVSLFVATLLAAGCATSFRPWQLSDVQEGMSRDQVVSILGEPDYTANKDGAEYLYYSYVEELSPSSSLSLQGDSLDRRAEELSRTFDEVQYEVVLVGGKLINYKELKD